MSHQIAYALTDRLPADILAGDRIHAPAPGPAQHEPARIILILDGISLVIPNGATLAAVQDAAQNLADMAETAGLAAMAEAEPAKKSRKKTETADSEE